MRVEVYTSIAANYLPKARVLAASLKRFHPEMRFRVVLVDEAPSSLNVDEEPFDSLILPSEIGLPNYRQWLFQHSVVEASTGVKGLALLRLLAAVETDAVLYFDPDIVILRPLDELLRSFESESVLLTPHLTEPEADLDAIRDNELSVLKHGIYNLGFLGVRKTPEGRRFAQWWADRLEKFCYDDIPNGLFTDQRWADLAPAFFPSVSILRDPAYNVCTWNLTHRSVEGSLAGGLRVNGKPIVFYHFSGFDSGAQKSMLDKYGHRMPGLYELRDWYLSECERFGASQCAGREWRYGRYDNGQLIQPEHRKLYREREDVRAVFPDPFRTAPVSESFYHWYAAECASPPARSDNTALRAILCGGDAADSRVRPAGPPPYRIVVWPTSTEATGMAEAVREIHRRSYRRDAFVVVGDRSLLDGLRTALDSAPPWECFVLDEKPSDNGVFGELLARFADQDLVIVRPPVDVPDLWDIRLAWSAYRQDGIASVSPVADCCSDTALSTRPADGREDASLPTDHQILDELCYLYSSFGLPDIESPNPVCVFLRAAAVHECVAARSIRTLQDFAVQAKRLRWSHILADHIYVGVAPQRASPSVPADSPSRALTSLRLAVKDHVAGRRYVRHRNVRDAVRPRRLHVMHSWGGGLELWVREFGRADLNQTNLILKSVGQWGAFGQELHLFLGIDAKEPVARYPLTPAIKGVAVQHSMYDKVLTEITCEYGIDSLIVSSLIGHSLDALRLDRPAVLVCHDYSPFCPALNVTFGGLCTSCTRSELTACLTGNPNNSFFRNLPAEESLELRNSFLELVSRRGIPMVAPSESVRVNYERLAPQLAGRFQVIPHGTAPLAAAAIPRDCDHEGPLRVLVLGRLSPHKGLDLLRAAMPLLQEFAELYLIGTGEAGREFQGRARVTVVPEFQRESLPDIVERIQPDVGLLLSVVQETFSYTLQEMFEFAIPVVATRVGSFSDRIREGENGFLVDPQVDAVVARLAQLAQERGALQRIHQSMLGQRPRNAEQMVADYDQLLATPPVSERAYFGRALALDEEVNFDQCTCWWGGLSAELNPADATSIRYPIAENAQSARLTIPARPEPAWVLGLSLMSDEGFVLVHGMQLFDHLGECICYSDTREGTMELILTAAKGFPWATDSGLMLYAYRQNPQTALRLPEYAVHRLRDGGYLQCDFTRLQWPAAQSLLVTAVLAGKTDASGLLPPSVPAASRHGEEFHSELRAARERISNLENSISWKVTAPFRAAGSVALRLMPLLRAGRPRPR